MDQQTNYYYFIIEYDTKIRLRLNNAFKGEYRSVVLNSEKVLVGHNLVAHLINILVPGDQGMLLKKVVSKDNVVIPFLLGCIQWYKKQTKENQHITKNADAFANEYVKEHMEEITKLIKTTFDNQIPISSNNSFNATNVHMDVSSIANAKFLSPFLSLAKSCFKHIIPFGSLLESLLDKYFTPLSLILMGISAVNTYVAKDTLYVKLFPQKVIDNIVHSLPTNKGTYIASYIKKKNLHSCIVRFKDDEFARASSNTDQRNITEYIKEFINILPSMCFVRAIHRYSKETTSQKGFSKTIYPVQDPNVSQQDKKIINYASISYKRYMSLHADSVSSYIRNNLGLRSNFIRRKIGMATPRLSPIKSKHYIFVLQTNEPNIECITTNILPSYNFARKAKLPNNFKLTSNKLYKNSSEIKDMVINLYVSNTFQENLQTFLNALNALNASCQRNRFKKPTITHVYDGSNEVQNKQNENCKYYQVFPYDPQCTQSITLRPPEDNIIYNEVLSYQGSPSSKLLKTIGWRTNGMGLIS